MTTSPFSGLAGTFDVTLSLCHRKETANCSIELFYSSSNIGASLIEAQKYLEDIYVFPLAVVTHILHKH